MKTIGRGLLAGLAAGLVLAALDFVDGGTPGRTLPGVLRWFGITIANGTLSRLAGFVLLVVLGGLFGLLFAALQRKQAERGLGEQGRGVPLSRALVTGLLLGLLWWIVFSWLLSNSMNHRSPFALSFAGFLSTFPLDLLFGLVLGATYFQLQERGEARA